MRAVNITQAANVVEAVEQLLDAEHKALNGGERDFQFVDAHHRRLAQAIDWKPRTYRDTKTATTDTLRRDFCGCDRACAERKVAHESGDLVAWTNDIDRAEGDLLNEYEAQVAQELADPLFDFQALVHRLARSKGWHDEPRTDGDLLALIHSEVSEALEAVRNGNPPSDKPIPHSALAEELADIVIRVLDYAHLRRMNLADAILAKHAFNRTRPHRHGGKAL